MREAPSNSLPAAVLLAANINVLRCFGGSGIRTVVTALPSDDLALKSRLCTGGRHLLNGNPELTLATLEEIGRAADAPPVLFYNGEPTLGLVSRHRERLAGLFRFLLPPADLVEGCNDKLKFLALADRAGLAVPRQLGSDAAGESDVRRELAFPVILKPATTSGWYDAPALLRHMNGRPAKMLFVPEADALPEAMELMRAHSGRFVIQEYIPGSERRVHSFHAYVNRDGRPLAWYVGRKVRTWPARGGVSTCLELVRHEALARRGLEIVRKLGVVGPVKIDFKQHADTGEFYVLELNLRFNLWHYLGARCGINIPLIAHRDLAGLPVEPAADYRTDVRWWSIGNDLRAFLRDYRPAGTSVGQFLRSLRRPRIYDIFAWSDPWPFAVRLGRFAKRKARKLIR